MAKVGDLVRRKGGDSPYWSTNDGYILHWDKSTTGTVSMRWPDGTFKQLGHAESAPEAKRFYVQSRTKGY